MIKQIIKIILKNKSLLIGTSLFCVYFVICLLSLVWTPYDAKEIFDGAALLAPSAKYFLGTDDLGRDLFSRLLVGSQLSIGIGLFVGGISVIFGASLGLMAGYFGKKSITI